MSCGSVMILHSAHTSYVLQFRDEWGVQQKCMRKKTYKKVTFFPEHQHTQHTQKLTHQLLVASLYGETIFSHFF